MISTTTTWAPADLLGQGGLDVRPVYATGPCAGLAERAVAPMTAPTAPSRGTGLPTGSASVRLRPDARQAIGHDVVTTNAFDNNGTTLGYHSSGRPQS
ncbi:hypothetical protein [Blastococcus tunisiensis]|uniref:Uncharacterized protein n=1 Tax=Blastococcus tunisiensis TaxID=1798228 RepID=A0A1I2CBI5_9ACTN|nr:hypothetical protein [Blastococcus sp. DSM 46838]SFE65624.1 hypothetical protein SAMN05216574_10516 [Blastococcus sp. DSM 46838]